MKKYTLPDINKISETVILANGNFPTHKIPLSILDSCTRLIACDGATNKLVEYGKFPHVIVGDCDSLSNENKKRFSTIIHKIDEQETNDLTKAVHFCINNGWKDIIILGATGEREDHTIGNISLLSEYLPLANVTMVTNFGIIVAINKNSSFESYIGQQVSLFPLDRKPISTKNLKYKIDNQVFDRWWQATLNESESNEFFVETEGTVIIYRAFKNTEEK